MTIQSSSSINLTFKKVEHKKTDLHFIITIIKMA